MRTWKKRMVAIILAFVMVMGIVSVPASTGYTTVEAASKKKDKKKPVITMKGKSKMTVTKGKSVKIPKVTAKDNKDGNVTKKIKVTVKKGKKSFVSIAKKIKNNKKVKFTETGKYTITYTVTDKAGNKATKKRYVTVKAEKKNTEVATEEKTEEEDAKVEYKTVKLGNYTYNVTNDDDYWTHLYNAYQKNSSEITITIENDYDVISIPRDKSMTDQYKHLEYLGKITATDKEGNDISNKIVIFDETSEVIEKEWAGSGVYICVEHGDYAKYVFVQVLFDSNGVWDDGTREDASLILLSEDPLVYVRYRK